MSVVNKMLRDLQNTQTVNTQFTAFIPSEKENRFSNKSLLSVLLVVVAAAIFIQSAPNKLVDHKTITTHPVKPNFFIAPARQENIDKIEAKTKPKKNIEFTLEKINTVASNKKNKKSAAPILQVKPVRSKANKNLSVKVVSKKNQALKKLNRLFLDWKRLAPKNSYSQLEKILVSNHKNKRLYIKALSFTKRLNPKLYTSIINRSLENFPSNSTFLSLSAKDLFVNKEYSSSIKALESINKKYWRLSDFRLYGLALQKLKKHDKAIEAYQESLRLFPRNGQINMALAISLEALGKQQKAKQFFLLAIKDKNLDSLQKQFIQQRLVAYQG